MESGGPEDSTVAHQKHIKNKVENRATSAHYDKQNVYIVPNKDAKYTMGEATNNTSSTGSSSPIEYGSVCITGVCSHSSTSTETKNVQIIYKPILDCGQNMP